jgi:hypothetical protein
MVLGFRACLLFGIRSTLHERSGGLGGIPLRAGSLCTQCVQLSLECSALFGVWSFRGSGFRAKGLGVIVQG